MIKKHFSSLLVTAAICVTVGVQSVSAEDLGITAFYGDKLLDRVVVMDVDKMTLKTEIYTQGIDPYPVDQAGVLDKVYAITRGSNSIDVIDANTLEPMGLIELPHFPRSSEAYNETLGLQLVTGVDKPMATLIDVNTDTVVASVGLNQVFSVGDYGGSNATGHPFWFNENQFALIDRPNRTIHLYAVGKGKGKGKGRIHTRLLDSVPTPTAVHHFIKMTSGNAFYALSEGSPSEGIAPSILKYVLKRGKLNFVAEVALSDENIYEMGSHHADMHPDGIHMYIGSAEGNVYVLNTKTMKIITTIPAGLGAGHTTFVPERNIAVVTNHKDTFVSIVDIVNHKLIKNVTVSGPSINGQILQSHSTFIHPEMNLFYAFATDNGIFYELDLETLKVSRTVEQGGTPIQGVFMCQVDGCQNLM